MTADYQVRAKIDKAGNPLLILAVRVEHEVILDSARVVQLEAEVQDLAERGEITAVGNDILLDTLDSLSVMLARMKESGPDVALGLESPWRELPHKAAAKLVERAERQRPIKWNVFLRGAPPRWDVVFNIADVSFRTSLAANQVSRTKGELKLVESTFERMEREGRTPGERQTIWRDLFRVGKLTGEFVGCAVGLGEVAAGGTMVGPGGTAVAAGLIISACVSAVDSAQAALDAEEQRDRAARDRARRDSEGIAREGAEPVVIERDRIGGIDVSRTA